MYREEWVLSVFLVAGAVAKEVVGVLTDRG